VKKDEQKPGTLSLSVANVENASQRFRFPFGTGAYHETRLTRVSPANCIPTREFMARGWDAENNEWRSVLWPALDKHFRAADLEGTKPVWKIQCPWKGPMKERMC
jgi:hypothetical protein